MKHGLIKTAAASYEMRVADCAYNKIHAQAAIRAAAADGVKLLVLPELGLTGYTCGDLFLQDRLLSGAQAALASLIQETADLDMLTFVGLPFAWSGKLYNVAAAICRGKLLGLVPKLYLPNYGEFYELRQFTPGWHTPRDVTVLGQTVPMGADLLFSCQTVPDLVVACELCEDLWAPLPPSTFHAMAGATVVVNLSASDSVVGKDAYRRSLVAGQSARLLCAYVYASAGEGESSTDLVFSGQHLIGENGTILAESNTYAPSCVETEIDVQRLQFERRRRTSFQSCAPDGYRTVAFSLVMEETTLTRFVDPQPFVPADTGTLDSRCEEILNIQAAGIKKRIIHSNAATAVIGLSGGLDSTLALLVVARAMDAMGRDRRDIVTVTMPGFGTTGRTKSNAEKLAERLHTTLRVVPIGEAVSLHFRDIGVDPEDRSVTYENCQARERTQVLMDIANQTGGMVVGTGDLSELALGWATYNGDHMSMYGVNAGVPKTLVRHIVRYVAGACGDAALKGVLLDILDTPVSPELLPPAAGEIAQKTEELVGPYELHDFFLYYAVRWGFSPAKVFRLACYALPYDRETILKWLRSFYRRFFAQQFKRSCLPDGPKVGSVTLSPRGDWRMPSDASPELWQRELDEIS